jgi:tripartite-type tricarboxylate transporter receptor subunit TctC
MKLPRRQFLHLAAGTAGLPAASRIARAQTYPARPVRIVVGFAAGGGNDIHARLIGQWLSERLGQQFIVDNRPGASGNIGTEAVVRAPPDGYTLLLIGTSNTISALLYDKLTFNIVRDIAPVASLETNAYIMVVRPSFPARSVSEFITYTKANPGKINMASPGNGSAGHLCGELFKMMTGVDMVYVPYRGEAPALTDMIGGQVDMIFATIPGSIGYIKSGNLRALAVTTPVRSRAFPDISTVADFLPGYEALGFAGIGAPRGTPPELIEKLNREINAGLASPGIQARYAEFGATVRPAVPADFGKLLASESEKWGKVVKFAGLKAD